MNEDEEQKKKAAANKKNALRVAKSRAKKKAKALEEAASTSEMETQPPKQVDVQQVLSGNRRAQLMYHAYVEKQAMLDVAMQTYCQGMLTVREEMVKDMQTFLTESQKKANGFVDDVANIASTLPDSEDEPPADRP